MVNILLVVPSLWKRRPSYGPATIGLELSKRLTKAGHNVQVISNAPFGWTKLPANLLKAIHSFDPDVIHIHGTGGLALFTPLTKVMTTRNIVLTLLDYRIKQQVNIPSSMIRLSATCANRIICLSQFMADSVRTGLTPRKAISVIRYGLKEAVCNKNSINNTVLKENEQSILFFGDATYMRGFDTVLKAFTRVREQLPSLKLLLALREGNATLKTIVKRLAHKYPHCIDFYIPGKCLTMEDYVASCSAVVLPFRVNPMEPPLTLLESMALGKPVITTNVGGNAELVGKNQRGMMIEPGNVQMLADRMFMLLRSESLRQSLGECASQFVHHAFNWNTAIERLSLIYEEALRK